MSRGWPMRPSGMPVLNSALSSGVRYGACSGVSTIPGWMTLERMWSLANWMASDLLSEMRAPLAAVYASWARVKPASADTLPTRMTEPPPAFCRCGMPCLVTQNTLLRLMPMTRYHWAPSVSSTDRSLSFQRTPALLYRTWRAPQRRAPSSTIRFTSSSTATSPTADTAWPPAFSTRATVSSAACLLMSHTTIRAPSSAKRREASRPIPIPAPVMRATLPLSLVPTLSDPLEEPNKLPVRYRLIEGLLLQPRVTQIVLHHRVAERLASDPRALELVHRLAERLGHLGEGGVVVGVAVVVLGRLELLVHSVEPRRDGGGKGEIWIRVGAGNAVLHAKVAPLAAETEAARAVVPPAGNPRGGEGTCLVALVGVDGGRVEVGELPRHGHLPGQPLLEEGRPLAVGGGEEVLLARAIPHRGVKVEGRARRAHVVLGHEGDGRALLPGDLLHSMLVEHVSVRHLEGGRVAKVDLLLASAPLPLGELHGHPRRLHVVADGPHERLLAGGLQDVIVLQVARDGGELQIALGPRLVEGLAEEIELELGGRLHLPAALARALELPLEHPARRLLDGLALLRVHVAEDERRLGQPRDEPPRGRVGHHLHVAVAALPRGQGEAGERLHLHVHREEVDAGVHAVVEDMIEEVAADHALAHEAAYAVGEHGEDGVDLARADERLERFGLCLVGHQRSPLVRERGWARG